MVSREILAACRRGDQQAFEEVVRATHRQVYTQALRLVRDRHEAEDVAQEAYLRVYRGLAGFRGDALFETWLYRIVANTAMNHLRRRGRFGDLMPEPDDERMDPTAPDAQPADQAIDREALRSALEALPEPARGIVIMKDVYGLSCQEIGDMVGASEGAIKVRLHRARHRLKDVLFESGERDEV
jgi:RNA polymerase sigma-70 factor, ECF subfamily